MGRALLANFRELAEQDQQDPIMVEMVQRFEVERSDFILQHTQDTIAFMRMVGDITNLFFPAMLDTLFGISTQEQPQFIDLNADDTTVSTSDETKRKSPKSPDQGTFGQGHPGDGPTQT